MLQFQCTIEARTSPARHVAAHHIDGPRCLNTTYRISINKLRKCLALRQIMHIYLEMSCLRAGRLQSVLRNLEESKLTESCVGSNGDTWEIYSDRAGEWRWRRTAKNGNIVGAAAEGYVNKSDCIANAKRNGMDCNPS